MLSYRHGFHAGNFADVFKHSLLTLLLTALQRKDRAFCYLETHAGAGRYDLGAPEARQTNEFQTGIIRIWQHPELPVVLRTYRQTLLAVNPDVRQLRYYPGSPWVARYLVRPQDRMILNELHPQDVTRLQEDFHHDRQVAVHHQNGYQALKAFLPPAERRGLVLIDPSYEVKSEFEAASNALVNAWWRWPGGIYALWYPIINHPGPDRMREYLQRSGITKILQIELTVMPEDSPLGLNGSGMLVINPPWQLEQQLDALLPWLWQVLSPEGQGRYGYSWLVPELAMRRQQ